MERMEHSPGAKNSGVGGVCEQAECEAERGKKYDHDSDIQTARRVGNRGSIEQARALP
jgi:hypothetical protein